MSQYAGPDATRAQRYVSGSALVNKWLEPDGSIVVDATPSQFNTGQVLVGTSATQIIAANPNRVRVTIYNLDGNVMFIGNAGVTATTGSGVPAVAGYPVVLHCPTAVYGVVATGTNNVSFIEETA